MNKRFLNETLAKLLGWKNIIPSLTGDVTNYPPSGLEGTDPDGNDWERVPDFCNLSTINREYQKLSDSLKQSYSSFVELVVSEDYTLTTRNNWKSLSSVEQRHLLINATGDQRCRAFIRLLESQSSKDLTGAD